MMKLLFSFFFTIIIACSANAQAVNGTLQDDADKTPVANATIKLSAVSNDSSAFTAVSNK